MPDSLMNTLSPSITENELDRRKRELAEKRYATGGLVPSPEEQELDAQKRKLAEERYASSNKPSVPEATPGLPPSGGDQIGGVDNTVAQAQAKVNSLLPNRPSEGALRKAVSEYEKAAQNLREQSVDTTEIDKQLADAKALYNEKSNRNEMLSVVQMIAQSFARLAAYNYGSRQGRFIADQVSMPSTDYEKRTDRALDEYKLASGEAREQRHTELDRADKRYQIEKDRAGSLKERIGAEESALGRATSAYTAELTNMAADRRAAAAENKANERSTADETRFNRMFGQKDYDNVQQEEQVLRSREQAANALTQAMTADTKEARKRIPELAAKAGITPEELEQAQKDTTEEGLIFDSAQPDKAAAAISQKLLPNLREKIAALAARKKIANEMARTGESMEQVRARLEAGGNAEPAPNSDKKPTTEQIDQYVAKYPQVDRARAEQILTDRLNGRGQ